MTEREENGFEFLLGDPEIVAWLEPDDADELDDELSEQVG